MDSGPTAALQAMQEFKQRFPRGSIELHTVQFCRQRVAHRYLLASGGGALYAAFMGTKELRDVLADISVGPRALWNTPSEGITIAVDQKSDNNENGNTAAALAAQAAAVHGGFLSRAEGIPAESLLLHALKSGRRLVLCG